MRALVVAIGIATLLVVTVPARGVRRPLGPSSWVDAKHGWVADIVPSQLCKTPRGALGDTVVCATEDGGKHWHTIFSGGNYVFAVVRTSRTAGAVSTGAHGHSEWWTRDAGAHWYFTTQMGQPSPLGEPGPRFAGGGRLFFWSKNGHDLFQVAPWPARGSATCNGTWSPGIVLPEQWKGGGNVCVGAAEDAGMQAKRVASFPDGTLSGLEAIPGGVASALVHKSNGRPAVALFTRRDGRSAVRALPLPRLPQPRAFRYVRTFVVRWPRITISADWSKPSFEPPYYRVTWRSSDGGRTWKTTWRRAER